MRALLEKAWKRREGAFGPEREALRIFHGPGEGGALGLKGYAVDRFADSYWVTEWEPDTEAVTAIREFLAEKSATAAVILRRPKGDLPAEPEPLIGAPTEEKFAVREGSARFLIQLLGARHPGLFLDHQPLRAWLARNCAGKSVLNTFAYTGSLSVAAALGGAAQVTTLDLSRPTIEWARENWRENGLLAERGDFIYGDVFEWLPRLARRGSRFGCVILDPPSFSRGRKGNFSTARDLPALHELALSLLEPEGWLVTSINSANVTRARYREDVEAAAKARGTRLQEVQEIGLPRDSFPGDDYLKGWIFKAAASRPAAAPRS